MTETEDARIPVTLLTGFLGAGKTTLLNTVIQSSEAGRIAVIMNEFGDVGLDHDLIESATEETILLQSGCLCCSIRGDLAKTLSSLMERKERGQLNFDRVVVETTGIADPGPILHTLVVDDTIASAFRMDGVVTVADAATGQHALDTQFEAVHQIATADLIVVTKTDLVSQRELTLYEARIDRINTSARRVFSEMGRVQVPLLFGLSAMRADISEEKMARWLGAQESAVEHADCGHDHSHHNNHGEHSHADVESHDHTHHDHHHDHRFVSVAIEVNEPIPANVFDFWLDTLIALKGANILRMKGLVHVEGMQWPFVFHGVQHIFDAPVPLKSWCGKDTISRVVIIARDMTEAELAASLETLRIRPAEIEASAEGMLVHTTSLEL